jgi:hypothetical protein
MRNVYVVRGSEDGVFAVYGNRRSACERAIDYTTCGLPYKCNESIVDLVKHLREYGTCTATNEANQMCCEVEYFNLQK